jgi:putative phage-type endonuclease
VKQSCTLVNLQQGTPEWLNWRFEGIGASDAPAIMGENPWKSRSRLMKEKFERKKVKLNAAMIRGTELEPVARESYEKRFGIAVPPACLQSNLHSWMRASVDGITSCGTKVIEIKCGEGAYWNSSTSGAVPTYYMGQLQHILAVTGLESIDYWCFVPKKPEIHIQVERDESYIARLIEMEKLFWHELSESRMAEQK